MKYLIAFSIFAVLLTGCAAEMMERHGDTIQIFHAPNEKPGHGGVIRYLNTGLDFAKRMRRSDAENQMKKFCSGPYTITAEGPRSKFGAAMPIGKKVSLEFDEYNYLAFECAK